MFFENLYVWWTGEKCNRNRLPFNRFWFKRAWQRAMRGWSDYDRSDLNDFMTWICLDTLDYYADWRDDLDQVTVDKMKDGFFAFHGRESDGTDIFEKYHTDEELDKAQADCRRRAKEGLQCFIDNFGSLWV